MSASGMIVFMVKGHPIAEDSILAEKVAQYILKMLSESGINEECSVQIVSDYHIMN